MLKVDWFLEVDWDHWMNSSVSLQETHPTVAREIPAEDTIDKPANLKNSGLAKTRRIYKDLFKQLLIEIRTLNYSIRTEQSYEPWVARFIAYCDNRNPKELDSNDIVSFLQYLAVRRNVAASTQNQALNARDL